MSTYTLKLHRKAAIFIIDSSKILYLPSITICTAIRFLQKFYINCNIIDHDIYIISRTCIFLACKVEETIRRLLYVINSTSKILNNVLEDPLLNAKDYWPLKEKLIRYEQILLRNLNFNVNIIHPHNYLLYFIRKLNGIQELAKLSWCICNDSMLTFLSNQYEPHLIAVAAIYIAAGLLNITLETDWYEKFDCNRLQLEDICNQLLDLYDTDEDIKFQVPLPPKRQ